MEFRRGQSSAGGARFPPEAGRGEWSGDFPARWSARDVAVRDCRRNVGAPDSARTSSRLPPARESLANGAGAMSIPDALIDVSAVDGKLPVIRGNSATPIRGRIPIRRARHARIMLQDLVRVANMMPVRRRARCSARKIAMGPGDQRGQKTGRSARTTIARTIVRPRPVFTKSQKRYFPGP